MEHSYTRAEAQQRLDQLQAFRAELVLLESAGVLHLAPEQQAAVQGYHRQLQQELSQRYDADVSQSGKRLTLGMQVASFLGAVALACSVFFLFYQYWGYFNTTAQVAILVAAPLLTYLATIGIRRLEQTGYFAKLMAMISFACFVLNIAMLGQIFNLSPTDNALLLWCLYAAILAYAFDIRLLLAVAIFCFYGFIAARVGAWGGMYWLSMGYRPENFMLPALLLFVIPSIFSHRPWSQFDNIYRVLASCGLLLAVLVLSHWGRASYLALDAGTVEKLYQVLGFVISAGLIAIGVKKSWAAVMNTGVVFFMLFLYTKFFDWWWQLMPKYLFFFVIGLTALLFMLIFTRLRKTLRAGV